MQKLLLHDRAKYPVPDDTKRWDLSDAKDLLEQDVKNGKHQQMKPKALRETQTEYKMLLLAECMWRTNLTRLLLCIASFHRACGHHNGSFHVVPSPFLPQRYVLFWLSN